MLSKGAPLREMVKLIIETNGLRVGIAYDNLNILAVYAKSPHEDRWLADIRSYPGEVYVRPVNHVLRDCTILVADPKFKAKLDGALEVIAEEFYSNVGSSGGEG